MKVLTALLLAPLLVIGDGVAWAGRDDLPEVGEVSLQAIPVCYDFGCKRRVAVNLSTEEWRSVADWFAPAASTPALEREQIKRAIGWMETVVGRHTPTHKDLALDLPARGGEGIFPGQLDCIDEAVNTTAYLRLFAQQGLLKHHVVHRAAYRRSWVDQHWAGQIREKKSERRFVVDSWFDPNGYLPIVQDSRGWESIGLLTAVVDNSQDEHVQKFESATW